MTTLLRLILAAAAAFGLWTLHDAGPRARSGALALDSAEVEAACAVSKFPAPEFYERAKAAGVQGVLLRPRTLAAAAKRGDLMVFTRADVDKMRRLGLLSAHSPLRADSVWSRDKEAVALLERMLRRRGLAATVTEMAGLRGLLLSEEAQPESLTVGYDRQALDRVLSKGLAPVFFIQDDADIEAAAPAPAAAPSAEGMTARFGDVSNFPNVVGSIRPNLRRSEGLDGASQSAAGALLVSSDFHGPIAVPALAETLSRGGWTAFSNGGPESSMGSLSRSWRARWLETPLVPSQALLAGEMGILEGEAGLRRELLRGNEIILARLDPARGVEWNFDRLRPLAGALRKAFPAGIPASAGGRKLLPAAARAALFWLAAILAVMGATLAMRGALDAVRKVSARAAFPQASPLLETACGLAVAAAASVLTGLAVHAALSVREWRLGLFPPGFETAVFLLTAAVGVAALFPLDPRRWSRGTQDGEPPEPPMAKLWTRSVFIRVADAALFMTAAALIVSPAWTQGSALASLAAVFAIRPPGHWLFLRRAEAALGQAALIVGFWTYCVQLRRPREADRTAEPKEDLRPWLLLGLLALAGSALSFVRLPIDQAARGVLAAAALGIPLGLLAVALRLLRSAVDVPNIRNS